MDGVPPVAAEHAEGLAVRRAIRWLFPILCLVAGAALPPEGPAEPPEAARERLREHSKAIRREIESRTGEAELAAREEEEAFRRLEEVDRALQDRRRRAADLKADLDELESRAALTREARADMARRVEAAAAAAAGRLAARYKFGRLGSLAAVAAAGSPVELLRRQAALERILSHDEERLRAFAEDARELDRLEARLAAEEEHLKRRLAEYDRLLKAAARDRRAREALLAEIRGRRRLQLAAVERLEAAARELDRQLAAFVSRPETARPAPPAAGSPPLAAMKGLLPPPVVGRIIHLYGPYKLPRANVTAFRSGIDIAAERGEPVRSVHGGRVLYCQWFKGYGNLVIIDHGEHYYSVYGHLEEIFTAEGRTVAPGDVIATVGDSASLEGGALYFELRHHGKALDPSEWLARSP
jgi:septal ring factor EnvC (AmiA/AmiB activator)